MNNDDFSTEVESVINQGLPAFDALVFVAFMRAFKPHELDWHSSYYDEWIGRFKSDRFARMDDNTRRLYDAAEHKISSLVTFL